MPIPTNINTLLSGTVVENARIEFKETWNPDSSLKTITAFANDIDNWGGGYIIIGVEDNNGRPAYPLKGVPADAADKILKDILNKCKLIKPDYLPIVDTVDIEQKKLIVIWCPGGPTRPYRSPAGFTWKAGKAVPFKEDAYFIRKMASTIKASDAELTDLFTLANHIPFDDRINHQAEISDLNLTLIKAYLHETGSSLFEDADSMKFETLCANMGISNSMPEYLKPKNVGLLFFSMDPEKYLPCARIDVVEFPDGAGGDRIVEKIFKGPVHQQLREALLYIQNSVIREKITKRPDRAEADRVFNYPFSAVKEALANAVYHKGYDVREPVEVRVEPDKIEILSYPGPDRSVTPESLKNCRAVSRRYRNRRIGDFLKELHLTEGRSTGFRKIVKALAENGSPMPEFETDEERSYFIARLYVHELFAGEGVAHEDENVAHEDENVAHEGENVAHEGVNVAHEGVNVAHEEEEAPELDDFIRSEIRRNATVTREEIAKFAGVSKKTVERHLAKMGDVRYVGSGSNGHWEILE